jgi:tRNA(Arg) A34 adenosine deaminase TadA
MNHIASAPRHSLASALRSRFFRQKSSDHQIVAPFLALLFGLTPLLASAALTPPAPLPDDPACTPIDREFMHRATALAAQTAAKGNTCYGAVLVKDGRILMEFGNDARMTGDVTHHAETGLISLASRKFGREAVAAAVLYTSTEPCIMCCGAIRAAGIKKFYYGTTAVQVARLRGAPVPDKPLQCREVFARMGSGDVAIYGPLLEEEGLKAHAEAIATAGQRPAGK